MRAEQCETAYPLQDGGEQPSRNRHLYHLKDHVMARLLLLRLPLVQRDELPRLERHQFQVR